MPESTEKRRWPRLPLAADVEFRRKRETHYTIPIHDLTPHGCRLASPESLLLNEMVWVQLPSLASLSAHVKWTESWQSGVEFERPMHPAVFNMMMGRLAPASN